MIEAIDLSHCKLTQGINCTEGIFVKCEKRACGFEWCLEKSDRTWSSALAKVEVTLPEAAALTIGDETVLKRITFFLLICSHKEKWTEICDSLMLVKFT